MLDQVANGGAAWRRHDALVRGAQSSSPAARSVRRPAIELRGVGRTWRAGAPGCGASVRALRDVDLVVRAGEVVALAGGGGAGKTTLLLCAAGLVRPDEGWVCGWAAGRTSYVGAGDDWVARALAAADRGAGALALDVLDAPALAAPRAVAALAGSLASRGIAVLVAARNPALLPAFAARLVTLVGGRIIGDDAPLRTIAMRHRT